MQKEMSVVSGLWRFPVKSLGGSSVRSLVASADGPIMRDRGYAVIVDEAVPDSTGGCYYRVATQRKFPQMSIVQVTENIKTRVITLTHGGEYVEVTMEPSSANQQVSVLMADGVTLCCGRMYNTPVNDFLSKIIGGKCKLVHFSKPRSRIVRSVNTNSLSEYAHGDNGCHVEFSDQYPVSLLFEPSVNAFCDHVRRSQASDEVVQQITPAQFRMNCLISWGREPGYELFVRRIQLGQVILRVAGPCTRCSVIDVHCVTGERNTRGPLALLSRHAMTKNHLGRNAPWMGVYCTVERAGTISLNDEVEILEDADQPIVEIAYGP